MRIAVALAAVAVTLVVAAGAQSAYRNRYCSPTGDYCTSATPSGGAVKLRLATFSFSGRYKLCVKPSTGVRICKTFPLRRRSGQWVSEVLWYRHFPNRGTGLYTVTWFYGGQRLGPPLTFAIANS
ncbi:MAG TPA: hypothetical protein VKB07_11555 [Gaiellaceae bacterium]|nr:hypothetical protein [Gaiellaceae bacterium]